jgi:hypothetical protein
VTDVEMVHLPVPSADKVWLLWPLCKEHARKAHESVRRSGEQREIVYGGKQVPSPCHLCELVDEEYIA